MNGYRGGFGGGFAGGNLGALMKQAQKMQEEMGKAREEINSTEFTASAGGGMVETIMLGDRTVKSIKLKPEVVDPDDVEMLEDLIVASVNDCLNQITKMEKEKLPGANIGLWEILNR